ncbi:uncharacterized protein LOC101774709 [Setaria italica]|uniref:uncharacterized protein LOC101774709 n=1 Tax=Setaria italica TaxID=4555 RepID=UPI000350AF22|nr:uncharacterized protein LOC101774709 [Setaria italica]
MDAYCAVVRKLEAHFEYLEFHHVPREHNVATTILSKLGSKCTQVSVLDLDQANGNIQAQVDPTPTDVLMIEAEDDWRAPFIAFITDNMSPEDKAEHEKLARCSTNYVVISKELYKKAASNDILMKCILRN